MVNFIVAFRWPYYLTLDGPLSITPVYTFFLPDSTKAPKSTQPSLFQHFLIRFSGYFESGA